MTEIGLIRVDVPERGRYPAFTAGVVYSWAADGDFRITRTAPILMAWRGRGPLALIGWVKSLGGTVQVRPDDDPEGLPAGWVPG